MEAGANQAVPTIVIEPVEGRRFPDLRELWTYRDLLYLMARRDVVARHKQALAGVLWVVLTPLLLAGMFTVFLGVVAKVESPGIPYALVAVSGLVLWIPFTRAVDACTGSTVAGESLFSKIYLPRLAFPLTALANPAIDMIVGFILALLIGVGYGYMPGVQVIAVPLILLLALATAFGFGVWSSALNVKYRDFGLVVPTILLGGLFLTPITYPYELVSDRFPEALQSVYALNPMVGVLEAFRWAVLGSAWPGLELVAIPIVESLVLVFTGLVYYERAQRTFADIV